MCENVQIIVSWLLPASKGMYACVHYVHVRKQWVAYFLYTEMLTRMHVLHEDDICFTSMDAIFKWL